ncbi:MAG TPA: hypothetical protein VJK51_04435 [Candidatus Nanoarchaeia archaeon]|nr:hypothetical protein [Candidatus Nanoarchaeia archaeon]
MEENPLKSFTLNFFENIKASIKWEKNVLEITSVPKDFETLFGKRAPYLLIFNPEDISPNAELISPGSLLITSMKRFLEDKAKTTLQKINVDPSFTDIITASFSLKNASFSNITKNKSYSSLIRFTFATVFQYLNEKEQLLNFITYEKDSIANIDIDEFELIEGKASEIQLPNVDALYPTAKEHLKSLLQPKVHEIAKNLKVKLEKEQQRIKHHYENQKRELQLQQDKIQLQLVELEKQPTPEKNTLLRIERLKESLKELQRPELKQNVEKEEQFLLKDESQKHGLAMNTRLLNTSIIYYPTFSIQGYIKNADTTRYIKLSYNPLKKQLSPLPCESCTTLLKEIILCSGAHIICPSCAALCPSCAKPSCKNCLKKSCTTCHRPACKTCLIRCSSCSLTQCKHHFPSLSPKPLCQSCSVSCSSCGKVEEKSAQKPCNSCRRSYCATCQKSSLFSLNGKSLCIKCSQLCTVCGTRRSSSEFPRCDLCSSSLCIHAKRCRSCRSQFGRQVKAHFT